MKKKIFIVLLLLIILLGAVASYAYLYTDIFKSNKELFLKNISKNIEILKIFEDEDVNNYHQKQQSNSYTSNGKFTVNAQVDETDIENTNFIQILNNSNITFSGSTDKTNRYEYKEVDLNYSETESLKIKYIQMQDYYGIKIDDIVNKFISIENNNLKELARLLGVSEEEIANIPDKIEFNELITTLNIFSDEELNQLKNTYLSVVTENLTDEMFSKSKIENTNVYTLTITETKFTDILCKIIEKAKDDELILSKIKQVLMEQGKVSETEADEYINEFKNSCQELIDESSEQTSNEEEGKIVISIYVAKNNLIKTQIIVNDDAQTTILKNNDEVTIEFYDYEEESTDSILIKKEKATEEVKYDISINNDNVEIIGLNIVYNGLNGLSEIKETCDFNINMEDAEKINYKYENTITFQDIKKEDITLVDDMLFINTAPNAESIQTLFTQIIQKLEEKNNIQMNNLGVNKPIVSYYIPVVIPLGVKTLIQNPQISNFAIPASALVIIPINIYYSASAAIEKATESINENNKVLEESENEMQETTNGQTENSVQTENQLQTYQENSEQAQNITSNEGVIQEQVNTQNDNSFQMNTQLQTY